MNKRVIVTGSNGLIGSTVVMHLVESGYDVFTVDVFGDVDLRLDLSCDHEVFYDILRDSDPAYALINCYAYNDHVRSGDSRTSILDQDVSHFANVMKTNVTSLFGVCSAYARRNIDAGCGGRIVNFGASTGIVTARTDMYDGSHKDIAYSTSKAAVIHMTKILATHLVHLNPNFRVNCISPGGVKASQPEEFQKLYGTHTPAGRMCETEELLPVIDMLLDERNTYMLGANIVVDGGWTVQ